jgi:L-glutamine-phosphate cytidylyltransferase
MTMLILAAGQGTRLQPLTDDIPKCMVKLLGKTLIERQIETVKKCGVRDLHVVAGYKASKLKTISCELILNQKFVTTNMVYSFNCSRHVWNKNSDIIIAYGDIIYNSNVLSQLMNCDGDVSVVIDEDWKQYWEKRFQNPLSDAETLKYNEHGYICEVGQKPQNYQEIQGQYIGLIKISKNLIPEIKDILDELSINDNKYGHSLDSMYFTDFLQTMINTGINIKPVKIKRNWLEVDSVTDLKLYEKLHKQKQLDGQIKL